MRAAFLLSLLFAFSALAEEQVNFKNEREGISFYAGKDSKKRIYRVLEVATTGQVLGAFDEVVSTQVPGRLCSYKINGELEAKLLNRGLNLDLKDVIYLLRDTDQIDDITARILFKAYEVRNTKLPAERADIFIPETDEALQPVLDLIAGFEKRNQSGFCFDETYRQFYSELLSLKPKLKSLDVKALYQKALVEGLITDAAYHLLEAARLNELENEILSLNSYFKKLTSLRTQYPLRDTTERANFVSEKKKKATASLRQRLFQNYTDLQIIMMGNVIKNVRRRLEWTKMTISGYTGADGATLDEVITTDPMERFRGVIKLLRKDINALSMNSYFKGRQPDYLDLVSASYEIGVISAIELETVAGLSEIWSPKKTFWDKAGIWIRSFSGIATLVIPPPYGFIPSLIVVIIEATSGKKPGSVNDPGSIF